MAELSGLWTTTGGAPTGDQQVSYTQAQWSTILKIAGACMGSEGVAADYLNELAGTVTGANAISINTGGAIVDGKWYENSAATAVTIPSAVGGGNTRIDRIVLRCSWAGYSVRITRIPGVDAASPTAPAVVTTSGTTYDVLLYRALVNTSGTVTLTDERGFALIETAELKDLNVTYAKLAPGAGKLTNRQGGSATDWTTPGTTNYIPTGMKMQVGASIAVVPAVNTVTFPVAFGQKPQVFIQALSGTSIADYSPFASNITTTGFTANLGYSADTTFFWWAIGVE